MSELDIQHFTPEKNGRQWLHGAAAAVLAMTLSSCSLFSNDAPQPIPKKPFPGVPSKIQETILKLATPKECEAVDPYEFLEMNGVPRQLPDGSVFGYDCYEKIPGWFFRASSDTWHTPKKPVVVPGKQILTSIEDIKQINTSGVPINSKHPKHPDALTLDDLKGLLGKEICIMTALLPASDNGIPHAQPYRLDNLTLSYTEYGQDRYFNNITADVSDTAHHDIPWSFDLRAIGVMPHKSGLWSRNFVTLSCSSQT